VTGHPVLAALYDRMMARVERDGLDAMRGELIAAASGRTLELGAGTGHNLHHYGDAVTELILTEPDPHMAKRLRSKLAAQPPVAGAEVVEAPAERLPVDDGSVDTVVATLVFCTIPDPDAALTEVARALRPGGQLLFLEHVRSESSARLAAWQDRLERPWGWVAGGCHPNRDTAGTITSSGLEIERLERLEMPPSGGPMVRPLIRGSAVRSSV
jgi:ubiquinone/menaquinone biosynthesis C-methylase UbiE